LFSPPCATSLTAAAVIPEITPRFLHPRRNYNDCRWARLQSRGR
jgi:hypothetical protein